MLLGLGSGTVLDGSASVVVERFTLHLHLACLVHVQDGLRIYHCQQDVAQVGAIMLGSNQSQSAIDSVHRNLGHALQYVVNALCHAGVAHEWLVYHHRAESLVVLLLQYQHRLRHLQPFGVGHVECLGPSCVGLHQRHQLSDLRRQFVHGCRRFAQRIKEHLKYLVGVHPQRITDGIQ